VTGRYGPGIAPSISRLIQELNKLPGIGPKSAQRLTYHIIRLPEQEVRVLAEALLSVKKDTLFCSRCQNISDQDPCEICSNPERTTTQICVVEEPLDVLTIERTGCYRGLYHVLHGVISPINGVGPEDIRIRELLRRLKSEDVKEVILATNPTLEGESTAMYIRRQLTSFNVKLTHLARGLPVGGDLEYADETTLSRAFQGRQEF
jgi:recombination protein RecR